MEACRVSPDQSASAGTNLSREEGRRGEVQAIATRTRSYRYNASSLMRSARQEHDECPAGASWFESLDTRRSHHDVGRELLSSVLERILERKNRRVVENTRRALRGSSS